MIVVAVSVLLTSTKVSTTAKAFDKVRCEDCTRSASLLKTTNSSLNLTRNISAASTFQGGLQLTLHNTLPRAFHHSSTVLERQEGHITQHNQGVDDQELEHDFVRPALLEDLHIVYSFQKVKTRNDKLSGAETCLMSDADLSENNPHTCHLYLLNVEQSIIES